MVTAKQCFTKYGDPEKHGNMVLWDVPTGLEIGIIPKRIYCNKDLIEPLSQAFRNLIATGAVNELKTWDGCFNIRPVRGYEKKIKALLKAGKFAEAMELMSLHSWAICVDVNAFENQLGKIGKLSPQFVKCFKDAGFDWGGDFKRSDPMHFQLSKI